MNELTICNENNEVINMMSESDKVANDFFGVIAKKGPREFLTEIAKLNTKLKIQEIATREVEIKEKYSYDTAVLQSQTITRLAEIDFKKTVFNGQVKTETEREKTEQLRITEQSKCLQKIIDTVMNAYEKKMNFYEAALKACNEYYQTQINTFDTAIQALNQKRSASFNLTQETLVTIQRQLNILRQGRREANHSYERIYSELINAVRTEKLEIKNISQISHRR